MANRILMVADDGRVFQVDANELGKVAKEVPTESLSADAKAHIAANARSGQSGAPAYLFASRADLFVANKADLFVANKADLFVSGKG